MVNSSRPESPSPAPAAAPLPSSTRPSLAAFQIPRNTGLAPAKRRRRWVIPLVVVLTSGVFWKLLVPGKTEVQVAVVQTAFASQQFNQLAASGYVVAQRRAAVASKATGRLVELNVREGSVLKKGELIARVDAADVTATLGVSQAAVRQAEAALKQAQASLLQAQTQQANADEDLKRTEGLVAQSFVSAQALDAARTRARTAQAATAAAQAGVGTAQAAIGQAQAQMQVAQVSRDSTEIRAPFDGVVLVKNANVGDLITPFSNASGTSAAVVTMADMGTLEVEADVSEASVAKVKVDQPVEITLDALPGVRFRGSVSRIVPTVDRAKATVMTKVRFEALDARILPEMSAKVSFLSQAVTSADQQPLLAVSPKAVVQRDGGSRVLRLGADDTLELVAVTTGRSLGDLVEIKTGELKAGDRLVQNPAEALKAGSRVAVAAAGAK